MRKTGIWLKLRLGKKLIKLHIWNAWTVLLLAVTGILLFIPSVREMGAFRVQLKYAHIVLGCLSIFLLLLYIPLIRKHLGQIRKRANQKWNLLFVLFLLAGWALSGVLLWQFRLLPPAWSNMALVAHDLLTWLGVPYAVYHSISRSRWVRNTKAHPHESQAELPLEPSDDQTPMPAVAAAHDDSPAAAQAVLDRLKQSPISRSTFLRWAAALLLVFGLGPSFYRWMKRAMDMGGSELAQAAASDGNHMIPLPVPTTDSSPPIGGGAKGNFRVYTVTALPEYTAENWSFALGGLVQEPRLWKWDDFLKLKRTVQVSDFHCVTGWSVYKCTWEGIPLKSMLEAAKVQSGAKFVKFYSGDGVYTDAISMEQAMMDDVMVAVMIDGKLIPQELGGPVRLIVPKMYAYKSVKWLRGIELIDKDHIGYWEARGYDNDAWVGKSNGL